MKKFTILITTLLLLPLFSLGQRSSQNIRGTVRDVASNTPLPFCTVVIPNTNPQLSATTNEEGEFAIKDVAVGRYNVEVSYVGYNPVIIREILVTSAKEVVLDIAMQENVTQLAAVTVKPKVNKAKPLNKMAAVSARMLSTEEASRYAGGFDDPARLASSFAGVASNIGNNGIVVRGNAPKSLQWRLEDVEIPNPNHFADVTVFGGGGITALSSHVVGNSDFFTGAFPAEYGNALSGVFDMKMKTGNNQKVENTIQLGAIGIDVASEGPFKKGGESSYLFNYRYSTLALVAPVLPEGAEGIHYQDLSYKLNFPTKKAGTFSLWGIGLIDRNGGEVETDSTKWEYEYDRNEHEIKQYMGAGGLAHQISLSSSAYMKTTLAATVSRLDAVIDYLNDNGVLEPESVAKHTNSNFVLSSYINKKFGTRHTNRTGVILTGLMYNIQLKDADPAGSPIQTIIDESGSSALLSAYSNSSINLSNKWQLNLGVHGQLFTLNNHYSIEPRTSLTYSMTKNQSLSLAYGLHSRLEYLNYYFIRSKAGEEVNKDMDFTRSHHLVLSYDWNIGNDYHLRIEPYVQQLFNVPVVADSSLSLINLENEWFVQEKFENTGKGFNYGVDVTFEKFMSRGYYFMVTGSLFNSRYKGGDGVWRDTRFNRSYLFNFLIGKEWMMGRSKQNIFSANVRFSYQGGDRYSPINYAESLTKKEVVYDERNAFSKQLDPSFVGHFTVSYTINRKRAAHEFAIKIINFTGYEDYYGHSYNFKTHTLDEERGAMIIPNISYKIQF